MTKYERIKQMEDLSPNEKFLRYAVDKKWYVETIPDSDGRPQGGTVTKVIRDRYKIPVCLEVQSGDGVKDRIPVDRVAFFEQYSNCGYGREIFEDYECDYDHDELVESLLAAGYIYDEEEFEYRHPKTGDVVCW